MQERNAWRAVVHLNLVRSVNDILSLATEEFASQPPPSPGALLPDTAPTTPILIPGDSDLKSILDRLSQLRPVQYTLERQLGAASTEAPVVGSGGVAAPWKEQEFGVRSRSGWRGVLNRVGASMGSRKATSPVAATAYEKDEATMQAVSRQRVGTFLYIFFFPSPSLLSNISAKRCRSSLVCSAIRKLYPLQYRMPFCTMTTLRRILASFPKWILKQLLRPLKDVQMTSERSGHTPVSRHSSRVEQYGPKRTRDCKFVYTQTLIVGSV